MKYAVILPDGAADEPVGALGGQTPLEAAHKPNMDWVVANGLSGVVVTVPDGFLPGSDVATLSLFGYDPRLDYTGRAPLEAAAQGLAAGPDDLIFRCNFVTVVDGKMHDFTAGHIPQSEADRLIGVLNREFGPGAIRQGAQPTLLSDGTWTVPPPLPRGDTGGLSAEGQPPPGPLLSKEGGNASARTRNAVRFHSGVSYRNLLVAGGLPQGELRCVPPHDIPDQPIDQHLPRGAGAEWVQDVMNRARPVLAAHPINAERTRRGDKPVTDIWLWGQGRQKRLQPFLERFGLRAAAIAAVDLIRGIAKSVGVEVLDVKGATGYLDTDYEAKGVAACVALADYDLVFVHVEAPDEAGHQGDAAAKVKAIEEIDRHVVGPLLDRLRSFNEWRILIAPDHPTPVEKRVHTRTPPPFCIAGTGMEPAPHARSNRFSESRASSSGVRIDPGHRLLTGLIAGEL